MALIPESTFLVTAALFKQSEKWQETTHRAHLGASQIGEPCHRKLWYSFRWALPPWFDGRTLRIFRRGKQEEKQLIADLRACGFEVEDPRPALNASHFGGTPDGLIRGIPLAPKTWHILEIKTTNAKGWAELAKHGVMEAKPTHYAQMQAYMKATGLDRALYLAVNKDTDDIYEERVPLDQVFAQRLFNKAHTIIHRQSLPERISDDPAWFECRTCPYHVICHSHHVSPTRNCRTCLHSTPEEGGRWVCDKWRKDLDEPAQEAGCSSHLYLPAILWWLEQVDATEDSVIYKHLDGTTVPAGTEWRDGAS